MILSIDIGFLNMGIVLVDDELNVKFKKRVNISEYTCQKECLIGHASHVVDYVNHLFVNYRSVFEQADIVLLERQPPGGLQCVEALLFNHFRDRAILISPNAVHAYLQINHLNYEERKKASEKIANMVGRYESERVHDLADAFCMAKYYVETTVVPKRRASEEALDLDAFRYEKKCT